jgi:uncharacterized protein
MTQLCIAFEGSRLIASGELASVAARVKKVLVRGERGTVLLFDLETSQPLEIDFRGSVEQVLARLREPASRGPGRPKLGVMAREVTLLPRHWDWLAAQPGGTSVALRKLVEDARKANAWKDRHREAQNAAYRFMAAMAGNAPDYEEAIRSFFAGDAEAFERKSARWPAAVRDHARHLASRAFALATPEARSGSTPR